MRTRTDFQKEWRAAKEPKSRSGIPETGRGPFPHFECDRTQSEENSRPKIIRNGYAPRGIRICRKAALLVKKERILPFPGVEKILYVNIRLAQYCAQCPFRDIAPASRKRRKSPAFRIAPYFMAPLRFSPKNKAEFF